MTRRVKARAHANIALVKYWGKRGREKNLPATSSISLALDSLVTETEVQRTGGRRDRIEINEEVPDSAAARRIVAYLDLWRRRELISGRFYVSSRNLFPTGAGLASSASGFAALATALSAFSPRSMGTLNLSRLARLGSGSAARSIPGGLAILPVGTNPASRLLMAPGEIPWGMVVAITEDAPKETGSTDGMELSRTNSPFYKQWITQSKVDYTAMIRAISRLDFSAIGAIAEGNALAMHACMMATRPSLIYWNSATVELIRSAKRFRADGLETYFTIDAGPNVAFLCRVREMDTVAEEVAKIGGVESVITGRPAGGAEIVERE